MSDADRIRERAEKLFKGTQLSQRKDVVVSRFYETLVGQCVHAVAVFGEVANIGGRGRSQVKNAQVFSGLPGTRQLAQPAGAAGELLRTLRRDRLRSGRTAKKFHESMRNGRHSNFLICRFFASARPITRQADLSQYRVSSTEQKQTARSFSELGTRYSKAWLLS